MLEDGYQWPRLVDVQRAVGVRLLGLLAERGEPLASLALRALRGKHGVLDPDEPHSPTPALVVGCALSAGARLEQALWPAAAMELVMVSADLLDDVADGDSDAYAPLTAGVVLTVAAGLLALAGGCLANALADGVSERTVVMLGQALGMRFTEAAEGQARSLGERPASALAAYRLAAGKSGPFGALAAELGSRVGTDDEAVISQFAAFGRHFAVYSQLVNDARDAAPATLGKKGDVRDGSGTVPLAFTHSSGAPAELSGEAVMAWESAERLRISAGGGLAAGVALAEAERLHGLGVLDALREAGRPVAGLRALLGG